MKRVFTHPLFAPALLVATFGLGAATVAFLLFGHGLAPWADTLLTSCFGWNAATRRYRLDVDDQPVMDITESFLGDLAAFL